MEAAGRGPCADLIDEVLLFVFVGLRACLVPSTSKQAAAGRRRSCIAGDFAKKERPCDAET